MNTAEWIYNRIGRPIVILDNDCIRDNRGRVVAWINKNNLYSLHGRHRGWFENGVLFDAKNRTLGFTRRATGHVPARPGLKGRPGIPFFFGRPAKPGFSSVPGRRGCIGWSGEKLEGYLTLNR